MRRPLLVLVPCVAALIAIGTPAVHLRLAGSGVDALPPSNQARQGYDTLVRDFAGYDNSEIPVVAYFPNADPATGVPAAAVAELEQPPAATHGVVRVLPPVTGQHVVLLLAVSNLDPSSDAARAAVSPNRTHGPLAGGGHMS